MPWRRSNGSGPTPPGKRTGRPVTASYITWGSASIALVITRSSTTADGDRSKSSARVHVSWPCAVGAWSATFSFVTTAHSLARRGLN
jgi:hypothetical protein